MDQVINVLSAFATIITGFTAIVAIVISVRQGKQTEKALTQDDKFEQAQTVRHFTQLYFDFAEKRQGNVTFDKLKKEGVVSAFWSLLSTEYYFYREGAIPPIMFASWVVDLAELYAENLDGWESHHDFLKAYRYLHPDMIGFFEKIYELSGLGDVEQIHYQIKDFVYEWVGAKEESRKFTKLSKTNGAK